MVATNQKYLQHLLIQKWDLLVLVVKLHQIVEFEFKSQKYFVIISQIDHLGLVFIN
jgi:hypothetical protein